MILVRNSGSWTEFLSLLLSGFLQVDHFLTLKPAPIYFRMKTLLENRGNDSCSLLDPPTDIWVDPVFPTVVSAQSAHRTRRGKKVCPVACAAISAVYIGWWFQILKTAVNIRQGSSILRLWSELTKNIRFIMIHPTFTFQYFPWSIFHVIFRSWSHLTYFGRSPGGPGHIHISQRAFKASRCRKVWRQRTDSTHHCLHLWGRVGLGLIGWFQVSRCLKCKKKQQSKIFSIKTRDSSTLIFWCFGSWGFKHDTYIMLHSFVVSCAADFSGPHSVMWMGAPWAPHTLNDSASELFLHWLVGWLVGWLFGWLIDVNWLVGWLFPTYAMIRAPINSITLVEWAALNCQDTYKLQSFYRSLRHTVAIRARLGVQKAERRIIPPGSQLVKKVATAGAGCIPIKYGTGGCQAFCRCIIAYCAPCRHVYLLPGDLQQWWSGSKSHLGCGGLFDCGSNRASGYDLLSREETTSKLEEPLGSV